MKFNFDEIIPRRNTYSSKWDARQSIIDYGLTDRYDDDTIPLFVADMDIACSPQIIDALHKTVDHQIFGYSTIPDEYYEALISWFKRRLDWDIKKEEIVYNAGTVDALGVALKAFTQPRDGVIVQQPVYPAFVNSTVDNNRRPLNNAVVNNDGYYSIDFEDFEKKAKQKDTKLFFLCNPHNPTGRIFTPNELKRMSDICKENDVLIVADEIHGDIIRCDKTFYPLASLVEDSSHIITCTGINKTFNTAGLHCSNIIIPDPKLREKYKKARGHQTPTPFAISALIAAYNESEQWVEDLKTYLDDILNYVDNFLKTKMPKVKMLVPEGTYIIWMDFREYGISPDEIHSRIYNEANVLLQNGEIFGEDGLGFQRMCIPAPKSVIKEAMNRISDAFSDLE